MNLHKSIHLHAVIAFTSMFAFAKALQAAGADGTGAVGAPYIASVAQPDGDTVVKYLGIKYWKIGVQNFKTRYIAISVVHSRKAADGRQVDKVLESFWCRAHGGEVTFLLTPPLRRGLVKYGDESMELTMDSILGFVLPEPIRIGDRAILIARYPASGPTSAPGEFEESISISIQGQNQEPIVVGRLSKKN